MNAFTPNVPDQRPRATDVWIATQTRSRGSLHPVGSATSCSHNLKISGRPRRTRSDGRPCHCAGNVTATDAKHTKRNPRHRRETPRPPNSTGGNGGNRGPIPSPFPPLPPVQNARAAQFRRTQSSATADARLLNAPGLKEPNTKAGGGSLKRLVLRRDSHRLESAPTKSSGPAATAGDIAALGNVTTDRAIRHAESRPRNR